MDKGQIHGEGLAEQAEGRVKKVGGGRARKILSRRNIDIKDADPARMLGADSSVLHEDP